MQQAAEEGGGLGISQLQLLYRYLGTKIQMFSLSSSPFLFLPSHFSQMDFSYSLELHSASDAFSMSERGTSFFFLPSAIFYSKYEKEMEKKLVGSPRLLKAF